MNLTRADKQADDLEIAATEMRALADELRNAPVPVAELAGELGEPVDVLARRVTADTYRDDVGRKVVTRALARTLIGERDALEEQRRQVQERNDAVVRASSQLADARVRAMLAGVDRRQAQFGGPADDPRDPAATVYAESLDDFAAAQESLLVEFAERERTARRYNEHGQLVDGAGNPIGGTSS